MKKSKIFKYLISACCLWNIGLSLSSCGSNLKYEVMNSNGKNYITFVQEGNAKNVVIPSEYEGKLIHGISYSAFENYQSLVNLTIPSSIKEIDGFELCTNLTNVYYDGTLEDWLDIYFNKNPMRYAKKLYFLDKNGTVRKNGKRYSLITNVEIPDTVKEIKRNAFSGCEQITNVTIPNGVEKIDYNAFKGCSMENVVVPESVRYIMTGAFNDCTKLKSLTIPFVGESTVNSFGAGNTKFLGVIFCGDNFNNAKISVPESLEEVIVTSASRIETGAFDGCDNIKRFYLSDSIKVVKSGAFTRSSDNATVYCESNALPSGWEEGWCRENTNVVFGVTKQSKMKTINELVYSINNDKASVVDCENKSISEISIPDNIDVDGITYPVTSIAGNAFKKCTTLTKIQLPNSIEVIGDSAFEKCLKLTSINIPNNVKKLGSRVFYGCTNLVSIDIPGEIETIERRTFENCGKLEVVNLHEGIKKIDDYAFYACTGLKSIVLPEGITNIGKQSFKSCNSLVDISIPNTIIKIGTEAFDKCKSLNYNKYNNGLYLGNDKNPYLVLAKGEETNITNCVINESAKLILYYAFKNFELLENIVLPNNITFIGEKAFFSCYSLTSIVIPSTVVFIESEAFSGIGNPEAHATLYCEVESLPSSWGICESNFSSYLLSNEWEYVDGIPMAKL